MLFFWFRFSFIPFSYFFFFNDTATTEIYTLSLHDALPISLDQAAQSDRRGCANADADHRQPQHLARSEEHTSELQSRGHLVCRLLLEKKNKTKKKTKSHTKRTSHTMQ